MGHLRAQEARLLEDRGFERRTQRKMARWCHDIIAYMHTAYIHAYIQLYTYIHGSMQSEAWCEDECMRDEGMRDGMCDHR
jgi:hypothetical protein